MKKSLIAVGIVVCLILTVAYAMSLTKEQKLAFDVCKKGCLNESKSSLQLCDSEKKECLNACKADNTACNVNISQQKVQCIGECQAVFNLSVNQTLNASELKNASKILRTCKKECSINAIQDRREQCDFSHCRNECSEVKQDCVLERNQARLACFSDCQVAVLNQTFPPTNGTGNH